MTDVRRGVLVDQAQIARDPDLNESASKDFVFVFRHGTPPSLAEYEPALLSILGTPRRKGYRSRCARELFPRDIRHAADRCIDNQTARTASHMLANRHAMTPIGFRNEL